MGALEALGVEVEADWGVGRARVHGCGGRFPVAGGDLFLGNAGTAMRCVPSLKRYKGDAVPCSMTWPSPRVCLGST